MPEVKIIVLDHPEALFVRAAEEITHIAGDSICTHGEFTFCLTGGNTPASTYDLLATRFHYNTDWSGVQFFWGDERCVPPDDPASNFAMAKRTMLDKLEPQSDQIHRIRGEDLPEEGARSYEEELLKVLRLEPGALPSFNLVLLGLGENAHIASLFPYHPALHEQNRLAVAVEVDAPQRHRISLTAPVLNNAGNVVFLVSGGGKASAVKQVIQGPRDSDQFPAQLIEPSNGQVIWLLDKAAARLLS
jgi:6-phosphogluconolactonase